MAEYIEREKYAKLNDIIETLEHEWGYECMREDLYNLPTADVVSREVFEQVKWERDTALQTLEEHGIGLGQKADVVNVKHGEWGHKYSLHKIVCLNCGTPRPYQKTKRGYHLAWESNYCPNCGAKMDLKEGAENGT